MANGRILIGWKGSYSVNILLYTDQLMHLEVKLFLGSLSFAPLSILLR